MRQHVLCCQQYTIRTVCDAVCSILNFLYVQYRIGSLELEGGQSKHDESVVHLQPEESALRIGSLEMELAEAKESQARLEEDVRLLEEELKRQ